MLSTVRQSFWYVHTSSQGLLSLGHSMALVIRNPRVVRRVFGATATGDTVHFVVGIRIKKQRNGIPGDSSGITVYEVFNTKKSIIRPLH